MIGNGMKRWDEENKEMEVKSLLVIEHGVGHAPKKSFR
jgi:hypothetical protein